MHRLAGHPIALSDLNNGNTAGDDLHDGVITLLHDAQLSPACSLAVIRRCY